MENLLPMARFSRDNRGPEVQQPCVRELPRKPQPSLEFGSSFQFSEARGTSMPALHTGLCCLSCTSEPVASRSY